MKNPIVPLYASPNTLSHPLQYLTIDVEFSIFAGLNNIEPDTDCSSGACQLTAACSYKVKSNRHGNNALRTVFKPRHWFMSARCILYSSFSYKRALCLDLSVEGRQTLISTLPISLYHASPTNTSSCVW